MYLVETVKRTFETLTGRGRPSPKAAQDAVRPRKPRTILFADDGAIPNNAELPFIAYKGAVILDGTADPAAVFEALFAANRWGGSWRNGIYDYVHYHSMTHEVLGIARGMARVRFGGDAGKEIDVAAGDVVVLPAGTGHQRLMASEDFLVVGAYPPQGEYDECRGSAEEHARALKSIPKVPTPKTDPVYGKAGPVLELWRR
jgi:uncharacterized protein YjlB